VEVDPFAEREYLESEAAGQAFADHAWALQEHNPGLSPDTEPSQSTDELVVRAF
jgi:hypothetical protein